MQKNKDKLLEKIVKKNYNNKLEDILEKKYYEENVKSILLSILYKIETAYKDYAKVKVNVETKEEFIENLIRNIKDNCETIKVIKINSQEKELLGNKTFLIEKKIKKIICYPIERKLLYAIYKISKKDKIIKDKYFLINKTLSNLINIGSNINSVEPLRDFNGYSWTTIPQEIESIEHNIIYQNLIILLGNEFLNKWINNKEYIIDYMELFENELETKYGKKHAKKLIELLCHLSVLVQVVVNPEQKEKMLNLKQELENKLIKLEDKKSWIEELTKQKRELTEKIKNIDTTLNNRDLLQQEYVKRNSEVELQNKIFSIRILSEIMIREREEIFQKLDTINEDLKPQGYVQRKKELEKELEYLKYVKQDEQEQQKELDAVKIHYQKEILACINKKIQKAETKAEITDLLYQYRYLYFLPWDLEKNVGENPQLKRAIQRTGNMLIQKSIAFKAITSFSNIPEINEKIVSNMFKVRMIDLEELYVKITKEKEEWFIQLFDEDVFEEKFIFDKKEEWTKKDLEIKINKKIRLFNF